MRKLLIIIAIALPAFGQQALTHIVDSAYFSAGDPTVPGSPLKANCTLSISGQSNGTTVSISGTTFFPVTVKWAVQNGIVNGYLPPNLNGTSYAISGFCQPPYPTSFTQVWSIPATASLPYCPSIGGVVTCVLQGVIQPAPYATISQAVTAPTAAMSGYVPAWGQYPALTPGFPLVVTAGPNVIPETNLSGVLDWSFIQPLTGVVQSAAGVTSFANPSGSGSITMVGTGAFVNGDCLQNTNGAVTDAGVKCATGSIIGPSTTTTGYLASWANGTGTSLGQGFPVSSGAMPSAVLQLLGTGFASPVVMPAFSGVIASVAGGTVTTLAHPTGTGNLVATGTGTYTPGNVILVGANGDLVDGGFVPGSGGGYVHAAGITGANAIAAWSAVANTLVLGPPFTLTPTANAIPETGSGGTLANGFIQTASGIQIGIGNVLPTANQTAISYGSGSATVGFANPLILPGAATLAASTTGSPSLVLPNGTAPSAPTAGMIWAASNVPYFYNGSSAQSFVLSGLNVIAQSPLTGGSQALTGNVTIGIQTASASQLGAGNVAITAGQLTETYSGGTAILGIANPFTFPGTAAFAASTTTNPSFTIPSGVAVTSPANGQVSNQAGTLHFYYGSDQSLLSSTSSAGGNVSGTFGALTVTSVNGVSYPSSPATSGVPVITAANTAAYLVVPSCPDAGGQHLNWNGSAWVCGTTGGTAGSVAFSGILTGTNTAPLTIGTGGSLTFSGTGTNNASNVNGIAYPAVPGSIGMIPVVTSISGAGAVTYEAGSLTVAATANQTTVSGCAPVALTGTCTIGTVQSIGTASSPTFAGLQLGSTTLASAGTGTSTFPAVNGTVVTTGTSALVTNAMLANSSFTIAPQSPLSLGGSVALGGSVNLSIATASATQIGAGNVAAGTGVVVTYSGGVALVSLANSVPSAYCGAGVCNSTGSSYGTSYTVGAAANNLVQLNGSAQLPAVSAALLTNFPTLNQPTTGTSAGLNGVLMSALGTGMVYNTGGTGIPSIAIDCTAFVSPACMDSGALPASVTAFADSSTAAIGGGLTVGTNGAAMAAAYYQSGVTFGAACTFTITGGGGTGAVFTSSGTLSAGSLLTLSSGGVNYTTNPTTATVSGSGCSGTPVLTTLLSVGTIQMQDGLGNQWGIGPYSGMTGAFSLAPSTILIQGVSAVGANVGGGAVQIGCGAGTGNAAPCAVQFLGYSAGSPGSTAQVPFPSVNVIGYALVPQHDYLVANSGSLGTSTDRWGAYLGNPSVYGTLALQSVARIATSTLGSGGTSTYNPGDTFSVNGGNPANSALGTVLTTSASPGAVVTYVLTNWGTNYAVASGVATTAITGTGTGLTINIVTLGGYSNQITAPPTGFNSVWNQMMGGDVSGFVETSTVTAIQGNNISTNTPTNGQVLQWSAGASHWAPATIGGSGTVTTTGSPGSGGLAIFSGATSIAPIAVTRAGDIGYFNGSVWQTLAGNNSGTNCLQEASSGVPSWVACGGGGGISFLSSASDFAGVKTNATTLTFGTGMSSTSYVNKMVGNQVYEYTTDVVAVLSSGSATGTLYNYILPNGTFVCGTDTLTITSCTGGSTSIVTGLTGFPVNTIPIYKWTSLTTAGVWDATGGLDFQAYQGIKVLAASGSGQPVTITETGSLSTIGVPYPASVAFAALGSVPAAGIFVYCNNCTTAATCTGGGSGHMAVSNGTNWTCQ